MRYCKFLSAAFVILIAITGVAFYAPPVHAQSALRWQWCHDVGPSTTCISPVADKVFAPTDSVAYVIFWISEMVLGHYYQFETNWRQPNGQLYSEGRHLIPGAAFFAEFRTVSLSDGLQITGRLPGSTPGTWSVEVFSHEWHNDGTYIGKINLFTDTFEIGTKETPVTTKTYSVTVDVSPKVTSVNVDGQASSAGTKFTWKEGEQHSLSVQKTIISQDNPGTRYVFTQWSDGITDTTRQVIASSNLVLTAQYKTQHLLTVESEYGTATGGDWYDEGSKAYAELDTGTVTDGMFYNWVFTGWADDASGTTVKSKPITMDSPKTATAKWNHEFSMVFYGVVVAVVVLVVVLAVFVLFRRGVMGGRRAPPPPPPGTPVQTTRLSGEQKFCGNCHAVLPIEANVCSSCGQPT